ncbi:hypothetical protein BDW62DRAFT_183268 [Aspergillus aurantiobrunneus]
MKKIIITKMLVSRFAPEQLIPAFALRYLSAKYHPIRPKIKHMYDNRDPNTLWWRVTTSNIDGKRVLRSRAARKARAAFKQELKAQGFDAEGRKMDSDTADSAVKNGLTGNMTGSLQMVLTPASTEGSYAAMREEMKSTVNALIREQQKIQIAREKQSRGSSQSQRAWESNSPRKKGANR